MLIVIHAYNIQYCTAHNMQYEWCCEFQNRWRRKLYIYHMLATCCKSAQLWCWCRDHVRLTGIVDIPRWWRDHSTLIQVTLQKSGLMENMKMNKQTIPHCWKADYAPTAGQLCSTSERWGTKSQNNSARYHKISCFRRFMHPFTTRSRRKKTPLSHQTSPQYFMMAFVLAASNGIVAKKTMLNAYGRPAPSALWWMNEYGQPCFSTNEGYSFLPSWPWRYFLMLCSIVRCHCW